MTLQDKFQGITKLYVEAFLRKHDFFDDETGEYYDYEWVADEVGGILCVSDYFFGFDDIRYDIDNAIQKDTFFAWYEYCVENEKKVNYKSYCKGAR